jgi:hypothetical protein
MPTTQLTPVGVGWGDYVVAWLLTYQGSNCELWRHVYDKCMESELCRRVIEILPTIGYNLMRHKCYADLDAEIEVETEQAKPPNNASTKPTSTTTQNHAKTQKQSPSKPKRLSRLGPSKSKPLPWVLPPFLNPPHLIGGPPQTEGLTGFRGSSPRNCMWRGGSKKG